MIQIMMRDQEHRQQDTKMSNLGQLFDKEGEGWATAENLQKIKNGELTVEEAKKEFQQIQAENNDNADKTNFFGADQTREGYKNQKWDWWDWVPDDLFNSKDPEFSITSSQDLKILRPSVFSVISSSFVKTPTLKPSLFKSSLPEENTLECVRSPTQVTGIS